MTQAGGLRRAFNDIYSNDWPYGSDRETFRRSCDWCGHEAGHLRIAPVGLGKTGKLANLCRQCCKAAAQTPEGIEVVW